MNSSKKRKVTGFSLIETIVVVSVIAVLLTAVTTILFNSFKAKTRVGIADKMEENGSIALREIKSNIVSASGVGMTVVTSVPGVGTSVTFVSVKDGGVTTLSCIENGKIASVSASGTFDLTDPSLKVTGCDTFAIGETTASSPDKISKINFNFILSNGVTAAGSENYVSRSFRSSVVVRN